MYPEKGTVSFSAGLHGWAFTLTSFAKIYAKRFGVEVRPPPAVQSAPSAGRVCAFAALLWLLDAESTSPAPTRSSCHNGPPSWEELLRGRPSHPATSKDSPACTHSSRTRP